MVVAPAASYVFHRRDTDNGLINLIQLIGFMIVGAMLLFTVQALGEMAVLYPVNGAFFTYACRFIDESW